MGLAIAYTWLEMSSSPSFWKDARPLKKSNQIFALICNK